MTKIFFQSVGASYWMGDSVTAAGGGAVETALSCDRQYNSRKESPAVLEELVRESNLFFEQLNMYDQLCSTACEIE